MKHCISLHDFSKDELLHLMQLALKLKKYPLEYETLLARKWLLMLFQKTSTRTRLSFEIGVRKLGGNAVVMDWDASNFSISPLAYEAKYVSRQTDVIMARVKLHKDTLCLAENSEVPIINGCDDKFHPCQALADMMTMYEQAGTFEGQTLTFVGIHNNVANSLALGLSKVGARLVLVTPESNPAAYDAELMEELTATGLVERTLNLNEAVAKSQFVYTDTWVDMEFFTDASYQGERDRRLEVMSPYQLTTELLKDSSARIMHDMPVHPGYEISEDLIYDPRSLIFPQADNRLFVQQALMLYLLGLSGA